MKSRLMVVSRASGTPRFRASARLADAKAVANAVVDGGVETTAGLFRHAEPAGAKRLVDVFRRGADERHFEIVNHGGAVRGDGRHESPLHQIDQHRSETRLD